MKIPISLIITALLAAGCKEQPAPQIPELSAPGAPSAAGITRQKPAKTVTASVGPVKLTLELLETRLPRPGSAAFFRATLKNVGSMPFEFKPDFFKDPRFYPSAAGLHLEVIGPGSSKTELHVRLAEHSPSSQGPYTTEQLSMFRDLRAELDEVVRRAKEAGLDEGVALATHKSKYTSPPPIPMLHPGEVVESAQWMSLQEGILPVPGYAQLPFYLNTAGRYKVRFLFDYTSRSGPGAVRVATPWIDFEVARP